jgi:uncharacterized cupredoxin-like copper-binding protein
MHTLALQLTPIVAAEKSKVPFYVAGGLLVTWALLLSLVIGARRSDFPADIGQQRGVIAITAILVIAAVSMAVATSGGSTSKAAASTQTSTAGESAGTPAPASSPASAAKSSLKLATNAEGQLSYDTKQLSAKAGTVTIALANSSPVEHNLTIAEGTKVLGATPTFTGGSKAVTLKLKPGKYTFYCSVPGHRQAGMEGTLTVS